MRPYPGYLRCPHCDFLVVEASLADAFTKRLPDGSLEITCPACRQYYRADEQAVDREVFTLCVMHERLGFANITVAMVEELRRQYEERHGMIYTLPEWREGRACRYCLRRGTKP